MKKGYWIRRPMTQFQNGHACYLCRPDQANTFLMRKLFLLTLLACAILLFTGCESGGDNVLIQTNYGDIKLRLYDDTRLHKENFTKLVGEGYYDSTLFHRVIEPFMIQGGDPQSIGASAGQPLGGGGPGYTIDAEIGRPHLSGALAAARTGDAGNPERKSSGSQFYIVTGEPQSEATLDQYERMKGIKYSPEQREAYTSLGGRPDLDMDYTVFGEVIEGGWTCYERSPRYRPGGRTAP